jgi:peptidoglycan/LPS O-acetylase OafA/YrhL
MESRLVTSEIVPQAHSGRVLELDGVRALAVLGVIACHVFVVAPNHNHMPTGLPAPLDVLFAHGWLGVDLFFVLSGLLITSILLGSKEKGAGAYLGRFYERRALRILPLYLLILAILAVAYVPISGAAFLYYSLAFGANFAPLGHVSVPNGAGPFWSLAVEEQFYLFWPVLVLLLDRRKLFIILFAILAIEPFLRFWYLDGFYTWLRCDGLAAGALLALWFSSKQRSRRADDIVTVALLGLAATVAIVSIPYGGSHAGPLSAAERISEAIWVFAAVIVFAVSRAGSSVTRLLRTRFAIVTAEFSYCLYLIHVPLVDAYDTLVQRFVPQFPVAAGALGANLVRGVIVIALAYAVAAVSRRYVELPFLRMGRSGARPAPVHAIS